MGIPELTKEQRIESFINKRLVEFQDKIEFKSKEEFEKFCLKEIAYAMDLLELTNIKDIEEQVSED